MTVSCENNETSSNSPLSSVSEESVVSEQISVEESTASNVSEENSAEESDASEDGSSEEISEEVSEEVSEESSEDVSEESSEEKELNGHKIGDVVQIGCYEQDNVETNGKEDIEWMILDIEGDKALVISKYALEYMNYGAKDGKTNWASSDIREWLNGDFCEAAFSAKEKGKIVETAVSTPANEILGTKGCEDTSDKLFLLSSQEANKYFDSYEERICYPTEYAKGRAGFLCLDIYSGECSWFLRTQGGTVNNMASVYYTGGINYYGYEVHYVYSGIRPAMWIKL